MESQCSERIVTGEPCSIPATYTHRDGRRFCFRHARLNHAPAAEFVCDELIRVPTKFYEWAEGTTSSLVLPALVRWTKAHVYIRRSDENLTYLRSIAFRVANATRGRDHRLRSSARATVDAIDTAIGED